jgi:aspartyl-tRNA(Asn)/glutamyl-tRNA(Gln) amidotransferase subunit A
MASASGTAAKEAKGVDETYRLSRSEGFGPEVKRRILLGHLRAERRLLRCVLRQAQRVRRIIRDNTWRPSSSSTCSDPTCPTTAFGHGAITDPVAMYLQDIFTVQANLAGTPAISLPTGTHSNGCPSACS